MAVHWQWLLIACAAALVVGTKLKPKVPLQLTAEQKKIAKDLTQGLHKTLESLKKDVEVPLAIECCKTEHVIPRIYRKMPQECTPLAMDVYRATNDSERVFKSCPFMDCFMKGNKLYDEEKNEIDEVATTELIMNHAREGLKDITTKALKKCFNAYENKINLEICASGSLQFFACVMYDLMSHCPKVFWKYSSKPECKDKYRK